MKAGEKLEDLKKCNLRCIITLELREKVNRDLLIKDSEDCLTLFD